ncbi:MAG: ATP-binding protein, partial [Firmicutes bacterium]|nr:ATP-binding protein [Bacillota bacterium]
TDLLILDEVGYVPTSKRASELLFTVISNCYERQSIIVTSNLELGRWNEVFGDDRLTAALIDRVIHHAHILVFKGESYRYKQALKRKQEN